MKRRAWQTTVYGVAELDMTEHTHTHTGIIKFCFLRRKRLRKKEGFVAVGHQRRLSSFFNHP